MRDEAYAYLDFAIVMAPQVSVLHALARTLDKPGSRNPLDAASDPADDPDAGPPRPQGGGGLLGWLRRRRERKALSRDEPTHMDALLDSPPLFLTCDEGAELERLITWSAGDSPGDLAAEYRVSALAARPDWTLVEFADVISGMSTTGYGLSEELPEADVYFFRRSGTGTMEPHFDFHLYRAGDQVRRVLCHRTIPSDPEQSPWWEGIAHGPLTPLEDAGLYDGSDDATLLTADKQLALIHRLGLTIQTLFGSGARLDAVRISDDPDGAPLSVLSD